MNKSKLLIIEDEKATLSLLCQFFTDNSYDVIGVDNGLDGIKLIEDPKGHFNLILTDMVLPDISGAAIISIAKKLYPELPIVAITGWGEHPESLATEAQADLILAKPVELPNLKNLIADLLKKSKFSYSSKK